MTRTHNKHIRVYANGVDLSGYGRSVGALEWTFDAEPDTAFTDGVKNVLIGKGNINAGPLSAFLDNDAAGLFAIASAGSQTVDYMVAIGANAAPVQGDNVFAWQFEQTGYQVEPGAGFVSATVPFGGASFASTLDYQKPWGKLLHASGAATAANTAIGIDGGAATTAGGIFVYHLFSSNGTVALKVQDAATNADGDFGDLSGATSGDIDASAATKHGFIKLGTGATVKRYLRWQLAFNTADTCSFVCAFIRG